MKKLFSLSLMLLCCIFVCFAASASLNGEWHGTLKIDDGTEYPLKYDFKVDGNKLTGIAKGPTGDLPIINGELHGSEFTFTVTLQKMQLLHTGKFYPDSVSLDIECQDKQAHAVLMRGK